MTDQQASTKSEARAKLGALTPDELTTFDWLMQTIRDRFGASDRFNPQDPVFAELADQLVAKVQSREQ